MNMFCEKCHGVGEVPSGYSTLYGAAAWRVCPLCEGTGLDEDAARAELADEARFSSEAINADLAAWEASRPASAGVPF